MRRLTRRPANLRRSITTVYSLCSRPREQPIGGRWKLRSSCGTTNGGTSSSPTIGAAGGSNSTYNVVAGRSRQITGPYLDKDGKPLTEGGGTLVIAATTPNWRGPGHEAILQEPGQDYLVFHAYHGTTGRSFLQVSTMVWENGWPRVGALP